MDYGNDEYGGGAAPESIGSAGDAIWRLLPRWAKRKRGLLYTIVQAFGAEIDELRQALFGIPSELSPRSAIGDTLKEIIAPFGVLAEENESDASLKARYMSAVDDRKAGGTQPGLIAECARLGFTIRVQHITPVVTAGGGDTTSLWVLQSALPDIEAGDYADERLLVVDDDAILGSGRVRVVDASGAVADEEGGEAVWRFTVTQAFDDGDAPPVPVAADSETRFRLKHIHWSRYLVRVLGWDGAKPQKRMFETVRNERPSHLKPIFESELSLGTFNDWEPEEEPLTFDDGGTFNDWELT